VFNMVLFMDWQFVSGCSPPPSLDDAVTFDYGQPVLCPMGTFTPLLVCTLRRTRACRSATTESLIFHCPARPGQAAADCSLAD